jgi:hypothetical protein
MKKRLLSDCAAIKQRFSDYAIRRFGDCAAMAE